MTDKYPRGKLNDEDDGATEIAIGVENGCVKLLFRKPIVWLAFHPDEAIGLAAIILEHAKMARKGMV